METILSVLQVIISVIVIFLVLMHSGKDSGLSGAFGVGSGTGPARRRLDGRAQPEPLDDLLRGPVHRERDRAAQAALGLTLSFRIR